MVGIHKVCLSFSASHHPVFVVFSSVSSFVCGGIANSREYWAYFYLRLCSLPYDL